MLAHTRVAGLPWPSLEEQLEQQGYALTEPLLQAPECAALTALQLEPQRFRSRIDMARYRFGVGDYGYFDHPLPPGVAELRAALYQRLAPIANRWSGQLANPRSGPAACYPPTLQEFLAQCHARGQERPTPLLLHYEAGGYNCLHQDRYGEVVFPLQATAFLSRPGVDYQGGEFLLVEQRPRQQSRGTALLPEQGQVLIFPSLQRPVQGRRDWTRAPMRHGVSVVRSGTRFTLGVIFHDAQ